MNQHDFFVDLFGENPGAERYIQLWTKPDKRSHYFATASAAAKFAAKHPNDLYVAVSLSPKKYGPARRCPAAESAGIPGVWADIDVNGGPENKTGAASTKEDAEKLAFSILEPTIVIDSGYGLQAWWLFEDGAWVFRDGDDRNEGARIAAGWITLLRAKAQEAGFTIDSTQDLARLLRVPDTFNRKGGEKAPVAYFYDGQDVEGPRHSRDVIVAMARDAAPATSTREVLEGIVGEFDISKDAEPRYSLMSAAQANNPLFHRTWEHERKESKVANWSLSEYDLSLASMAANMGWDDQEIANLVVAHRRKYGEIEKALRPDYIRQTIIKARREQQVTDQERRVEAHLENLGALATQDTPDPDTVMAEFNGVIDSSRFKVREIIQDGDDPKMTRYRLIIEPGAREIPLGAIDTLFDPDQFAKAIAVVTGHVMMPVKRQDWRQALQALLNVRQVHVATDDTPAGVVIEWLARYLGERMVKNQHEACRRREPFEKDGNVFVVAAAFGEFVRRSIGDRKSDPDIKQMLKAAGFTTKTIAYEREDGTGSSRSYYNAPKTVVHT